jgi:putative membrane protein
MNTYTLQTLLTSPVLERYGDGWGPGPGPWFLLFPLLFWTTVIVLFFVGRRRGWWRGRPGEGTLADVFARGEIDEAEYRARLDVLRGTRK